MNRRKAIGSIVATTAVVPVALGADDEITDWLGWWERSKKYATRSRPA